MSGVVHGLRLNYIEFFNWSLPEEGYTFRPFARKRVHDGYSHCRTRLVRNLCSGGARRDRKYCWMHSRRSGGLRCDAGNRERLRPLRGCFRVAFLADDLWHRRDVHHWSDAAWGRTDWFQAPRRRCFRSACLPDLALLASAAMQGRCCASAINVSKAKPEVFGLSVAPAAIVEGFAVFAFVFALVLVGELPENAPVASATQ